MIFDVNIICDKHDNTYRIEDDDGFRNGEVRRWLINTFAMTNAIREARDLDDRISLEEIPSAEPFLSTVIKAIREQKVLNMHYQSFERNAPTQHDLMPYAIKLFRLRWYVIGKVKDRDGIMIFATDRIANLEQLEEKFKYPKGFNIHEYYRDSFGIIIDNDVVCERVRIKVMNNQAKYFRSLPLHHSQIEVETTPDYSIFEYKLKPTYDFEQEILSHREDVEVLEPVALRDNIKESVMKMAKLYLS
jgi:predicted DNA-binding transcriptional regulator YafY